MWGQDGPRRPGAEPAAWSSATVGLLASLQGVTAPRGQRRRSRVTARPSWRTRRHHSQDSGQTGSRAVRPQPAPKGAERALCLGPVPAAPSAASAPAPQTLRPDPLPEMAVSCPGIGVTGGHRKGPLPFLLSARERLKAAAGATESFVGASSEAMGHDSRKEGAFEGAGARRKLSIRALQFSSRTLFGGRGGVTPLRAAPWQAGGGVGRGASAGCSTRGCGQRGAARTPLPRPPLRGRPPAAAWGRRQCPQTRAPAAAPRDLLRTRPRPPSAHSAALTSFLTVLVTSSRCFRLPGPAPFSRKPRLASSGRGDTGTLTLTPAGIKR